MTMLATLPDVVAPCCEAVEGACEDELPQICPLGCAEDLVAFWDICSTLLDVMPDGHFPGLSITAIRTFVGGCRSVRIMNERGQQAECDTRVGGLEDRVQKIQEVCCIQDGVYVCGDGGAPNTCDAVCGLAFTPWYVECVEKGGPGTGTNLQQFEQLEIACSEKLPAAEAAILMSMVHDRDLNPECVIDTSTIKTMHDAKEGAPPCGHDAPGVTFCEVMISSAQATCKGDFCPLCPDSHGCDATCGYPCGDAAPAPPPTEAVCDVDVSGDMCPILLSAGTKTCEDDFCAKCLVRPSWLPSHPAHLTHCRIARTQP